MTLEWMRVEVDGGIDGTLIGASTFHVLLDVRDMFPLGDRLREVFGDDLNIEYGVAPPTPKV